MGIKVKIIAICFHLWYNVHENKMPNVHVRKSQNSSLIFTTELGGCYFFVFIRRNYVMDNREVCAEWKAYGWIKWNTIRNSLEICTNSIDQDQDHTFIIDAVIRFVRSIRSAIISSSCSSFFSLLRYFFLSATIGRTFGINILCAHELTIKYFIHLVVGPSLSHIRISKMVHVWLRNVCRCVCNQKMQ